jgi:hypothetical protein
VLTKNNLVKRHWKRCTKCCFCAEQETIQHLFFNCPIAQLTWGSVCFTFGVKKPEGVEHLLPCADRFGCDMLGFVDQ